MCELDITFIPTKETQDGIRTMAGLFMDTCRVISLWGFRLMRW